VKQFIWNTTEQYFTAIIFITEPGNLKAIKEVIKLRNIQNLQTSVDKLIKFLKSEKKMQEGYINFYRKSNRKFIHRKYVNVDIKKSNPP